MLKNFATEPIHPASGFQRSDPGPLADDALAHLIGISMDSEGVPKGLFATNRWVTDESWYSAEDTMAFLDRFRVEHASPNLAVNQWLTSFMRLCRPHIELLLRHRDQVIDAWQRNHPERDVLEDRALEITGYLPIDIPQWIAAMSLLNKYKVPMPNLRLTETDVASIDVKRVCCFLTIFG